MDALLRLFNQILSLAIQGISFVSTTLFVHKAAVVVAAAIFLLFYRLIISNTISTKRHDKQDWITFGIMFFFNIIAFFVAVPWIFLLIEAAIFVFSVFNIFIKDDYREVKTSIYEAHIIYEDNSNQYSNKEGNQEAEARKKARDGAIHRSFAFTRTHMKLGIPIFVSKFKFKIATSATEEQISKAVATLNNYFNEYNWRKQITKDGKSYEFTAELKTLKIKPIDFDKELSDELDWYVVPLGAIDVSTKKNAKETPYVWMMQDPKKEGKHYKCLDKTRLYSPAPHGFVVGQTGGGKSVLVNSMLAHWINKAKTERQVELYLCDAKQVEFKPYESLAEVKEVAVNLMQAVDLTDRFVRQMHERNNMMQKEGIKDIPLDGKIKLNRSININGHIIYGSDIIEYKTADGKIHKDRALNLDGRTDIIAVNIPDDNEKEEKKEESPFDW